MTTEAAVIVFMTGGELYADDCGRGGRLRARWLWHLQGRWGRVTGVKYNHCCHGHRQGSLEGPAPQP